MNVPDEQAGKERVEELAQDLLPSFEFGGSEKLTSSEKRITFDATNAKVRKIAIACDGAQAMQVRIENFDGKVLAPARRAACGGGTSLPVPAGKGMMVAVAVPEVPTSPVFLGWATP